MFPHTWKTYEKIGNKEGGLVTAGPGPNFQKDVFFIIWVRRQEQQADFFCQFRLLFGQLFKFPFCQFRQFGIIIRIMDKLAFSAKSCPTLV